MRSSVSSSQSSRSIRPSAAAVALLLALAGPSRADPASQPPPATDANPKPAVVESTKAVEAPAAAESDQAATATDPAPGPDGEASAGARQAYSFAPNELCPFCVLTPQFPEGRSGLHWHDHWRAVGTTEYIVAPALLMAELGLQLLVPSPTEGRREGPILFDGAARDLMRIKTRSGRDTAATISDTIFVLEVLHPTVIDPLIAAWWVRQSPRVAWQMFVINAQAYGLTILVNDLTKRLTARARPWVGTDDCRVNPNNEDCGSGGSFLSFYSGHAAVTATGAGLICAHHTQLALYQDPILDVGTCLVAVAGTAVTGAMRISADNHWASDVLVGHLTGYISGYLLPTLIYYKEFSVTPHEHPAPDAPVMAALPMVTPDALGVSLFGLW